MATKDRLTPEQGERMELVLRELARRGNQAAVGIVASLDRADGEHQGPEAKLDLIAGFYGTLFECLSVLQMAANSTAPMAQVRAKLAQMRAGEGG